VSGAVDNLGPIGLWTAAFHWPSDPGEVADAAAEIEDLGFGSVWIGLSTADLAMHEAILAATSRLVVASGIVNVWTEDPALVAANRHRLAEAHPGRFLLGVGAGHAAQVEADTGQTYTKPLRKVAAYLDELDRAPTPVPPQERIVAALGPKAIALAAERSAGAHPYLVTPHHTADARAQLGTGPLLVTEQKIFFETDADAARSLSRDVLEFYLELPNYVNNWRRLGFAESDFADGGSDKLVDAMVGWGDDEATVAPVRDHRDAGADVVVLQVLSDANRGMPMFDWRIPRAEWRHAAEVLL
jgi:probable F420-dependent oxidoreductase